MRLKPGDSFERYEIEAWIGEGGMGTVYRAFDPRLQRPVALKLLRSDGRSTQSAVQRNRRLVREARVAATLSHAHAVAIYDVGEVAGTWFIAMELVEGRTLRSCVGDAKLPMDTRIRMLRDVARALHAAHQRGLIHRDIKPENVMVSRDGDVKVLDFGIAHAQDEEPWSGAPVTSRPRPISPLATLTRGGGSPGTPRYMAPEQVRGDAVDARTDQFSWGVLAYELLTGSAPWGGDPTSLTLVTTIQTEEPIALRKLQEGVPDHVERVVLRAMAKDRTRRFRSMAEVLEELEKKPHVQRPVWLLAIAVAAAVCILVIVLEPPGHPPALPSGATTASMAESAPATPPLALRVTDARRLTFSDDCEEFPSFTPDGRTVVYDAKGGTEGAHLFALDLRDGTQRQLTGGPDTDVAPSVSPDGARVAFVRISPTALVTYVMPLDGSSPPRELAAHNARPSWSRDGKLVWVAHQADLEALDPETGAVVQTLSGPPGTRRPMGHELFDGSVAALYSQGPQVHTGGLALFAPSAPMRWLIEGDLEEALTSTPDGRHLLTVRTSTSGTPELLDVPVDGSPVTQLPGTGIAAAKGLSLSSDGHQLAWSTCRPVLRVSAVDAAGKLAPVLSRAESDTASVAPVPGTQDLAVVSMRSGTPRPWLLDPSGKRPPRELPSGPGAASEIAVSHDGARFVVATSSGLVLGDLAESRDAPRSASELVGIRRLTSDPSDASPSFRHGDGQVLFTRHTLGGASYVAAVSTAGGDAEMLLGPGASDPASSPTSDHVVYLDEASGGYVLRIWDGKTGARRPLSAELGAGPYSTPRFSPDGTRVALIRSARTLLDVDVATGKVLRTIQSGTSDMLAAPAYAPSGLFVLHVQWSGNLWRASVSF